MMEPIEAAPETRKTGHRWLDVVLSVTAIMVSLSSLYLAQNSSNAMERLVQANSMPFLQLESGNASDEGEPGFLAFSVRNAGNGPASIHTFEMVVDDQSFPGGGRIAEDVLRACCSEQFEQALAAADGDLLRAIDNDLTSPVASTFLAPNDEAIAWVWRRTDANATLWNAVDAARQRGRLRMRACYCSLFDECWVAETRQFPPRPVDACEAPAPRETPG